MVTAQRKSKQASGIGKRLRPQPTGEIPAPASIPQKAKPARLSEYDIFKRTIKRAENLIGVHKGKAKCEEHHLDCFRAAVVLTISALDAYVRTLVVSKILLILSDKKQSLKPDLANYMKNLLNMDELLEAARKDEFRTKAENAIRADFGNKSFQGEAKINEYMALAGYKEIFKEVSHLANLSETRLRSDLAKFTKRRHVIGHCGDFDLDQVPFGENTIDKEYAKECVATVRTFAERIYEITEK